MLRRFMLFGSSCFQFSGRSCFQFCGSCIKCWLSQCGLDVMVVCVILFVGDLLAVADLVALNQ